ncbi:hypothetical protein IL306_003710 [Fusarium sp. DS 682]|nr:hypothetical protein IL306_003710 [Fusarium sp. DS 682]
MGGAILRAFLVLFAITNFITFVLSAITATKYDRKLGEEARALNKQGLLDSKFQDEIFILGTGYPFDPDGFIRNPVRLLLSSSRLPFLLLTAVAGATWIIASLTVLVLFAKIRHFNHRVARYVFRIVAVATFVFLVIFSLTWTTTSSFVFPYAARWPQAKAGVIIAHINLLIGFFITLLSAVLDTPKDWANPPPTGPNSRRTSQG